MDIPILYIYDLATGEYLYQREAQLLNGEPLTECACGTLTPIPTEIPKGKAVCWNGSAWNLVEDHRQKTDDNGQLVGGTPFWPADATWMTPPSYMTTLGPIPANALLVQPEKPAPSVEELSEICRYTLRKPQLDKTDRFLMRDSSLSEAQIQEVELYRLHIKEMPSLPGYPWDGNGPVAQSNMPVIPDCIKDSIDK